MTQLQLPIHLLLQRVPSHILNVFLSSHEIVVIFAKYIRRFSRIVCENCSVQITYKSKYRTCMTMIVVSLMSCYAYVHSSTVTTSRNTSTPNILQNWYLWKWCWFVLMFVYFSPFPFLNLWCLKYLSQKLWQFSKN